ncbi:M15 family metallopeptidase [Flammeovirga aprica]|uniref:M15 family metallopeptidase n=1 Tax=Flammeovirga aprica JL-4 TaxID=694437 RepID=A0A7X9RWW4_9BACT|nr:D-alanyl-D-alanine carboxypeptidase family protein [Flammeovirga aprica]NME70248.1 M15 family metallopeptidase [Flammeovirga aprica JL-4]
MHKYFFIFLTLLTHSLTAQECDTEITQKNWKYRVNLSTFISQKEGIDINPNKIYYDFMRMPIGVPFNYIDFIQIKEYKYKEIENNQLLYPAYEAYAKMKQDAFRKNIHINIRSSYRNLRTQQIVFNKHGASRAEKPGYSEHHLLTTIDIRYAGENTKLFLWLLNHAFDYGFVPTYYFRIEKNIRQESWHWRYVGEEAAQWFRCAWRNEINNEINRLSHTFGKI